MWTISQIARGICIAAILCSVAYADKYTKEATPGANHRTKGAVQFVPDNEFKNLVLLHHAFQRADLATQHARAATVTELVSRKVAGTSNTPERNSLDLAALQIWEPAFPPPSFVKTALLTPNLFNHGAPEISPAPDMMPKVIAPTYRESLTPNFQIEIAPTRLYSEPFSLPTLTVQRGGITAKWSELQPRIHSDETELAACDSGATPCSKPAKRFWSIVELGRKHKGLARIGWINRAVNLRIRPVSDWNQYGYADYWASPLQTLLSEAGDCEDYAILKYVALRKAGIAPRDLRLVIVQDDHQQEEHAILAVNYEQKWLILDNRTFALLPADQVEHYHPLFVMDFRGVRKFTTTAAER